jgi:predicted nuclease of predicted toxin-antitoxin system
MGSGEDAVHVLEVGLGQSPDGAIWEYALAEGRVVVTKDEDFSNLLARSGVGQVVWVRLGNCRKAELLAAWERAFGGVRAALSSGQKLVVLV